MKRKKIDTKKIFDSVHGILLMAIDKRYTQENALQHIKTFLNRNF